MLQTVKIMLKNYVNIFILLKFLLFFFASLFFIKHFKGPEKSPIRKFRTLGIELGKFEQEFRNNNMSNKRN